MKTRAISRPFEVRELGDDGQVVGYGSVFDVVDSYRDIVMPGAFLASIQKLKDTGRKLPMLWQHRSDMPVGVWDEIAEDSRGLLMRGTLALDVHKAREARALMKMKAVRGLSIGFSVPKGGEEFDQSRNVTLLKQVELWETSIVTFPANEAAMVEEVRSEEIRRALSTKRNLERFLRDAGLPRSVAEQLASAFEPDDQGEPDAALIKSLRDLEQRLRA